MALTIATRAQDCLPGGSAQNTRITLYVGSAASDVVDSGGFGQIWDDATGAQPINLEKTGISVTSHDSDRYGSSYLRTATDRGWKWIGNLGYRTPTTNHFRVKMEDPGDIEGFGGFCWERQANAVYIKGQMRTHFSSNDQTLFPTFKISLFEPNWNAENGGGVGAMQTWTWPIRQAQWDQDYPSNSPWPDSGVNSTDPFPQSFAFRVDNDKIESFGNSWSGPEIEIEAFPNNHSGPAGSMNVDELSRGYSFGGYNVAESESGGTDLDLVGPSPFDESLWLNQYYGGGGDSPIYAKFASNTSEYELPVQKPYYSTYLGTGWELEANPSYGTSSPRLISATSYIGRNPGDTDDNDFVFNVTCARSFALDTASDPELYCELTSGASTVAAFTIDKDSVGYDFNPPLGGGIGNNPAQGSWKYYSHVLTNTQAVLVRSSQSSMGLLDSMSVKISASGLDESAQEAWLVGGFWVQYGPPANMGFLIPKMVDGEISPNSLRMEMETNSAFFTVQGGRDIADSNAPVQSGITVDKGNHHWSNANFMFNRDYGPSSGSEPSDRTWNPLASAVLGPNEFPTWSDGGTKLINSSYYEASKTTNYNKQARCRVAVDLEPFVEYAGILDNGTFRFRLNTTSVIDSAMGVAPTLLQPPEYQSWKCTFYYMTQENPPTIGSSSKIQDFTWYFGDSDADGYWTMDFDATASTILRNIISGNQFMTPQAVNKYLILQIQSLPDGWHTDYFDGLNEPVYLYPDSVSGISGSGVTLVGGDSIPGILGDPSDDSYVELEGKKAFRLHFTYPQLDYAMFNDHLGSGGTEFQSMLRPIYTFYSLNTGANAKYAEYRVIGTTQGVAPNYYWPNCRMDWGYYLDSNGSLKRLKNTNNLGINDSTCPRWLGGTVDGYTSENIWKGNLDANQTPGGLSPKEQGDMTLYLRNTTHPDEGTKERISRARVVLKPLLMGHINFGNSYFEFTPG